MKSDSMISRRNFLKGVLGAAALAAIPAPLVEAFVSGETDVLSYNGIRIDYTKKQIFIDSGIHTIGELYAAVNKILGPDQQLLTVNEGCLTINNGTSLTVGKKNSFI